MLKHHQIGAPGTLSGLRVVSFESRRAHDLALLVRRSGGVVVYAPAMREIPLADERGILSFGAQLVEGACDALILLTGVGTTILVDALCTHWPRAVVKNQLARTALLCRGPKPATVLRGLGLTPAVIAAAPHTSQDLLVAVDRTYPIRDKRVFVQEYGAINAELMQGLLDRGAQLTPVKVYRWALPSDTRDLRAALRSIALGQVDVAIFTSAHQVDNAFEYAETLSLGGGVRDACRRSVLVASLGPVTSEALKRHGIEPDLTPSQPKLGALVAALGRQASELQRAKQRTRS